ncbi:hypothetical protein GCM10009789_75280 [Kribbella sancticallisti]|uniref:Uncharacterized protein n=1 Tax=Kribbella sancticallisti TaxID=460087 RepID=A0ABN2EM06_9ACTN
MQLRRITLVGVADEVAEIRAQRGMDPPPEKLEALHLPRLERPADRSPDPAGRKIRHPGLAFRHLDR